MTLQDIAKALNDKRIFVSVKIFGTNTECGLYSEKSRVFIKTDKQTNHKFLMFVNEDYEQVCVDVNTIKSFKHNANTYLFNCGTYGIKIE